MFCVYFPESGGGSRGAIIVGGIENNLGIHLPPPPEAPVCLGLKIQDLGYSAVCISHLGDKTP